MSQSIVLSGIAIVLIGATGVLTGLALTRHGTPAAASARPRLLVTDVLPASTATGVATDALATVIFNRPLSPLTPMPGFEPPVPGTWTWLSTAELQFAATDGFSPGVTELLTVPGGSDGMLGADGVRLAQDDVIPFTVAPMSLLRVQQLLAQLDYLPLTFSPTDSTPIPASSRAADQAGTFTWRWSTLPSELTSLWQPGQETVMTKGAIMSFESQNGLAADGVPGPEVWDALLSVAAAGTTDPYGHYDWVQVSTTVPQSVTVWRDGAKVYTTEANTGVQGATTALGTWPVYVRYLTTTMKGTNPDGTTYNDPGVPWVSYFHGGDALHGFLRATYGTPQSLGCVEMPPAHAAVVYPYTPLGTLVTIEH